MNPTLAHRSPCLRRRCLLVGRRSPLARRCLRSLRPRRYLRSLRPRRCPGVSRPSPQDLSRRLRSRWSSHRRRSMCPRLCPQVRRCFRRGSNTLEMPRQERTRPRQVAVKCLLCARPALIQQQSSLPMVPCHLSLRAEIETEALMVGPALQIISQAAAMWHRLTLDTTFE